MEHCIEHSVNHYTEHRIKRCIEHCVKHCVKHLSVEEQCKWHESMHAERTLLKNKGVSAATLQTQLPLQCIFLYIQIRFGLVPVCAHANTCGTAT